jgi:hypothetical protein
MKNLIEYESINEAAKPLPTMPAFLKAAGAKEEYVHRGGPMQFDPKPNAWYLKIPGLKNADISFFPEGDFYSTISQGVTRGDWKADSASTFKMGGTTIKGVAMTITSLMATGGPVY